MGLGSLPFLSFMALAIDLMPWWGTGCAWIHSCRFSNRLLGKGLPQILLKTA